MRRVLWILTHIYGVGYMRGNNEDNHARFFASFSLAIAAVMGLAFSANMFTLFLFYEMLTLSTYPLVAHKGTPEAVNGARTYLGILMGTSIGMLLVAVVWTYTITGTLDFTQGGILRGHIAGPMVAVLLALYAFGIGKAALMPFHRWLPCRDGCADARQCIVARGGGGEGWCVHHAEGRNLHLWH